MNRTSAIATSLLLALPFAASAATRTVAPTAEADGDDLRDDDAPARPEVTFSGTAQVQGWYSPLPGLTLTAVSENGVLEISGGYNPPRVGGISEVAATLMGGWNFRVLGRSREGATLDLRLLAGLIYAKEYGGGGWFDFPLLGLGAAPELAVTFWLGHGVGLNLAAMGGVNMAYLTMPLPTARVTAGLTF